MTEYAGFETHLATGPCRDAAGRAETSNTRPVTVLEEKWFQDLAVYSSGLRHVAAADFDGQVALMPTAADETFTRIGYLAG